jgi:hypothetical protein
VVLLVGEEECRRGIERVFGEELRVATERGEGEGGVGLNSRELDINTSVDVDSGGRRQAEADEVVRSAYEAIDGDTERARDGLEAIHWRGALVYSSDGAGVALVINETRTLCNRAGGDSSAGCAEDELVVAET